MPVFPKTGNGGSAAHCRAQHLEDPQVGDEFLIAAVPEAATITRVVSIRVGGTALTFNLQKRPENAPYSDSSDDVFASAQSVSTSSTNHSLSGADTAIAAHERLYVLVVSATGDPTDMDINVEYEYG